MAKSQNTNINGEKFQKKILENGLVWMAAFMLLVGAVMYIPSVVYVSSSVGDRELPIYCVETDKKQVSLSFDAAWGNDIVWQYHLS